MPVLFDMEGYSTFFQEVSELFLASNGFDFQPKLTRSYKGSSEVHRALFFQYRRTWFDSFINGYRENQ